MATRSGGSRSKGTTRRASTARKSTSTARKSTARTRASRGRGDKSVQAFREALERNVTLSRDRLQEVVDEAVERGRLTRSDANELVSRLVSRGRQYTDELIRDLENLLDQARQELETRVAPARRRATRAAGRAARVARDAADRPLAETDRLRRRAPVPTGFPVTAYDQLTAQQVKSRLDDLDAPALRKVRDRERRGKARKSVLAEIERRLK
jgi:polyhydroxyalkanoate synthesis regulator phasin